MAPKNILSLATVLVVVAVVNLSSFSVSGQGANNAPIFYTGINFQGDHWQAPSDWWVDQLYCIPLPSFLAGKVKSIKLGGNCITLHRGDSCYNAGYRLGGAPGHSQPDPKNLTALIGWSSQVASFEGCWAAGLNVCS